MCGIAGVYLRDESAKADLDGILTTMLGEIEHRGGDATGFVAMGTEGVLEWQKAACDSKDFNRNRRPVPKGTRTILAHTRWATQGLPAFVENNHPLRRGSFYVIHNGHVSNDHKLFELANRVPYGQVDSEAIAARFASLGKLGAAGKVLSEVEGAAAIAAVDETKPDELLLARGHSSPLHVLVTKRYVLWGSTPSTITEAYTSHIGRLPKKAKIHSLAQGVLWHFVNGKLTKGKFKPYSPPKVTRVLDNITLPWKETSTEVSTAKAAPKGGSLADMLDCDGCGESVPWTAVEYEWDENSSLTWQLCKSCQHQADWAGLDSFRPETAGNWSIFREDHEGFDRINSAVLREDED
jgi:asparagine synthetase B (glutamine-hydrolysing)